MKISKMPRQMKPRTKSAPIVSPAKQIAGFIAKFDPKAAKLIRALRVAMRKRFPTATELVYDNYNFLVFAFCTTERASDSMVSLAADGHGVTLFFNWGVKLPDPHKILQGEREAGAVDSSGGCGDVAASGS